MINNVTYKEYSDYVSEATAYGNTFLSQTLGEIQKGAIAESQRLGVTADSLARDYQRFSDTAAGLAERAANAGNPRQAQFWNSHASAYGNAAAERAGMTAEAYVAKAAQDAKAAASNLGVKGGALVDAAFMGAAALEGFSTGDFSSLGKTSTGVLYSTVFSSYLAGFVVSLGMPALLSGIALGGIAVAAGYLGQWVWNSLYNNAKGWQPPRDPIILDLDGNGLQTVGLTSNIYFDHNGDGILSKTGWVGEGDALLVWDRNANGLIDNGAELFGDFTPLPDGTLAPNGFAALSALDLNGDGILDASDPAFAELKLWIDSDQNGVTGEGELMSLADAGIASLNLGSTLKNQKQSNGNTLAREGSFTRTDGTESAMGEFHLAIDTFDTQFAEQIEVPEELRGLPMMNGSGNVRDLQQAATQSSSLQSLLGQFENSTDRFEQQRNWSLCA